MKIATKLPRVFLSVLLLAVFTAGCSDSDATGPDEGITVADLVGTWRASSHVFTNNANSSESQDLIQLGGETRTTILTGGRARTWVTIGDFTDEWDSQLTIAGNKLTSTPAESTRPPVTWTFTLNGNTLTITRSDSSFDFTLGSGAEVSATETIVFVRIN